MNKDSSSKSKNDHGARSGMSAPTLKDVAERAAVSTGTVSAILSDTPRAQRYAQKTRERVLKAAHEAGYVGTPLGRILRRKLSGTLGIICFNRPDIYSSHLVQHAEAEITAQGYIPVVVSMHYDFSRFADCVRQLSQWRVEGILLMNAGRPLTAAIEGLLTESQVPYIALGSGGQNHGFATHFDRESGRICGEHLTTLGHERIGVLGFNRNTAHAHERLAGLQDALVSCGRRIDNSDIVDMPPNRHGAAAGYQCAHSLFSGNVSLTAAVCMNDLVAFGALRYLAEQNISVPEEISVVGFDDICLDTRVADENRMGVFMRPSLTTVRVPHSDFGRAAVQQLVRLVKHPNGSSEDCSDAFHPTLIVRESTRSVRDRDTPPGDSQ